MIQLALQREIIQGELDLIGWTIKRDWPLPGVRDLKLQRSIWHKGYSSLSALKIEKPCSKKCRQSLGVESGSSWQPARKLRTSVLQSSRNRILPTIWMDLDEDTLLQTKVHPANTLILALWTLSRQPSQRHLDFWPTELWANKWMLF